MTSVSCISIVLTDIKHSTGKVSTLLFTTEHVAAFKLGTSGGKSVKKDQHPASSQEDPMDRFEPLLEAGLAAYEVTATAVFQNGFSCQ